MQAAGWCADSELLGSAEKYDWGLGCVGTHGVDPSYLNKQYVYCTIWCPHLF